MEPAIALTVFAKAKEAIGNLATNDVIKARLDLAFDHGDRLEKQVSALERERSDLTAELRLAKAEVASKADRLQALEREHSEQLRIVRAVEFRRGLRTGGEWQAFCPKCHLPAHFPEDVTLYLTCSDRDCNWCPPVTSPEARQIALGLPR